jgi:hypothetical protein
MVVEVVGKESPQTAERLMTPTAVDRGGSVCPEPTWSVGFCLFAVCEQQLNSSRSSAKISVILDRIIDKVRKERAMRTIERATTAITAASLPEMALAATMLTILGLLGASPQFLLEIAVAIVCLDHLSRRRTGIWALRPVLAPARSLHRKRGDDRK